MSPMTTLMSFGNALTQAAEDALSDNPRFYPSESNCRYCRAQGTCPALHAHMQEIVVADFDDADPADPESLPAPEALSAERIARVVEFKPMIETWLRVVYRHALDQAQAGNPPPGLKVVAGRTQRKWTADAGPGLEAVLGDEAFEKKLIGITAAQKLVGRKLVDSLTEKPAGSPTLVPESDPREALTADFSDLTEN